MIVRSCCLMGLMTAAIPAMGAEEWKGYLDSKEMAFEYAYFNTTSRRELLESAFVFAGVEDPRARNEYIGRLERPEENLAWANAKLDDGALTFDDIAAAGIVTLTDDGDSTYPSSVAMKRWIKSKPASRETMDEWRDSLPSSAHRVLGNINLFMTGPLPLFKRATVDKAGLAKGLVEPLSAEELRTVEALIEEQLARVQREPSPYLIEIPPLFHLLLIHINQTGSADILGRFYDMMPAEKKGALAGFHRIFRLNAGSEDLANLLTRIASDLAWGDDDFTSLSGNLREALEVNRQYPAVQEFLRKAAEDPGRLGRFKNSLPAPR